MSETIHTPLPNLQDVSVKATVSGYLVGLDSILKYHNEGDNPVEVLFRFPLEESFAVVGLEVSNSVAGVLLVIDATCYV